MLLILDNLGSFTYNLYQAVGAVLEHPSKIQVVPSDSAALSQITALAPQKVILSPGPGKPDPAGICTEVITHFAGKVPILGIGFGHHAICQSFGGTVGCAGQPTHGKRRSVHIANGNPLFTGLPPLIEAGLYHSLAGVRSALPDGCC